MFFPTKQQHTKLNNNDETSPSVLWDACKAVIKGKWLNHLIWKAKTMKNLSKLESDLRKLEKEHWNNVDEKINQGIKRINIKINDILVQEIQKNADVHVFNVSSFLTKTLLPQSARRDFLYLVIWFSWNVCENRSIFLY